MNTISSKSAGKLLITVIEKHKCDDAMAVARKAGATGGTVVLGRGTAESKWLRLLGLDDVEKELLYCILPSNLVQPVMQALREAPSLARTRGIMFTLNVLDIFRHHISAPGAAFSHIQEEPMSEKSPELPGYELLSVIVNSGSADQVMDAARRAGATGGTVIHARGTARPDDATFFGITIVPEKELVMILSPRGDSERIMESIKADFKDAEPGSGIAFRMDVESFETLGPKKNR
ncbi:P-II family nitrogen regulator [Mailhella massiliensis]|uniref:P-II family nitrogen regulator n=1 Tax=Mailhella massiliensis TaxID=1903261 RepID=A0A921AUE8_9BACT|nr:P-II family nitrogen regulator [Mailhella massiliensis]HJD96029.1 P-II family nitrogen regulator [Mailhella massiliensis]